MKIKFIYSKNRRVKSDAVQAHKLEKVIDVPFGNTIPGTDIPSAGALRTAEFAFQQWFHQNHPGEELMMFSSHPPEEKGRFSEYRTFIPSNSPSTPAVAPSLEQHAGGQAERPAESVELISRHQSVPEFHASGGLRGHFLAPQGFVLFPLPGGRAVVNNVSPHDRAEEALQELGLFLIGVEERIPDPFLPLRIWQPGPGPTVSTGKTAASTWSGIGVSATSVGNEQWASIARCISSTIAASDLRLRDISDGYAIQLRAALALDKCPDVHFNNLKVLDVYVDIHSFLAEMASTRDYLATAAALRIGAPPKVDSLARLVDWTKNKPTMRADAAVALLLSACDEGGTDPWLSDLGAYRNLFLHRTPVGTLQSAAYLKLQDKNTPAGNLRVITLEVPRHPRDTQDQTLCDALDRLVILHKQLIDLSVSVAALAPFKAMMQAFTFDEDDNLDAHLIEM